MHMILAPAKCIVSLQELRLASANDIVIVYSIIAGAKVAAAKDIVTFAGAISQGSNYAVHTQILP
jgi:hypothetical protein